HVTASVEDLDVPARSVDADLLAIAYEPGGICHSHDGRQTVLAGHDRAVGHQTTDFCHQSSDSDECRRPTGIRIRSDEDVTRLEVGVGHVRDGPGASLDITGADRNAGQCVVWYIVAAVRSGDRFAFGSEHPRRRE